jgi:hypothetical protein
MGGLVCCSASSTQPGGWRHPGAPAPPQRYARRSRLGDHPAHGDMGPAAAIALPESRATKKELGWDEEPVGTLDRRIDSLSGRSLAAEPHRGGLTRSAPVSGWSSRPGSTRQVRVHLLVQCEPVKRPAISASDLGRPSRCWSDARPDARAPVDSPAKTRPDLIPTTRPIELLFVTRPPAY